jgi:hypothetical protein
MYSELVYRLGKRYSAERQLNPEIEFPSFSGLIADLVDQETLEALSDLQGERVIAYHDGQGTRHLIRVYFDEGTFEAQGTPTQHDFLSMSSDVDDQPLP